MVYFINGQVVIIGLMLDQENCEKIIFVVGNVQGVDNVDDQLMVEGLVSELCFYMVVKGDILWKIVVS